MGDGLHSAWVHYDDGSRPEVVSVQSLRSAATQSQVYGLLYERTASAGLGEQQQRMHSPEAKGEAKQAAVAMETSEEEGGEEVAGAAGTSSSRTRSAPAGSGSGSSVPQGAGAATAGKRAAAGRKR